MQICAHPLPLMPKGERWRQKWEHAHRGSMSCCHQWQRGRLLMKLSLMPTWSCSGSTGCLWTLKLMMMALMPLVELCTCLRYDEEAYETCIPAGQNYNSNSSTLCFVMISFHLAQWRTQLSQENLCVCPLFLGTRLQICYIRIVQLIATPLV